MWELLCFHIFFIKGDTTIFKELLINNQIRANEVRLLNENGEQLGIMPFNEAMQKAEEVQLDLVLLNRNGEVAVCKLMDYQKFKFDAMKKEKELKKNQKVTTLKTIRLSMTIDTHDMETKAKSGKKFLQGGDKLKIFLTMRGRQQAYAKHGIEVVKKFYEMVAENGVVYKEPQIFGRNIVMIVAPKK